MRWRPHVVVRARTTPSRSTGAIPIRMDRDVNPRLPGLFVREDAQHEGASVALQLILPPEDAHRASRANAARVAATVVAIAASIY